MYKKQKTVYLSLYICISYKNNITAGLQLFDGFWPLIDPWTWAEAGGAKVGCERTACHRSSRDVKGKVLETSRNSGVSFLRKALEMEPISLK